MSDAIKLIEQAYVPPEHSDGWFRTIQANLAPLFVKEDEFVLAIEQHHDAQGGMILEQNSWFPHLPPESLLRNLKAAIDSSKEGSFANMRHSQSDLFKAVMSEYVYTDELILGPPGQDNALTDIHAFYQQNIVPTGFLGWRVVRFAHANAQIGFFGITRQRNALSHQERTLLNQLRVHLEAAWRLHHAMRDALDPIERSEAVLEPTGRIVEVMGDRLKDNTLLKESIRQAAKLVDQARGPMRHQAGLEATSLWKGLVEGEYSLVDHFDTDGRRYVLLMPNAHDAIAHHMLTRRERQVVTLLSHGHSNKVIAYELGLSTSTISSTIHNTMKKIGVASRIELIDIIAHLGG